MARAPQAIAVAAVLAACGGGAASGVGATVDGPPDGGEVPSGGFDAGGESAPPPEGGGDAAPDLGDAGGNGSACAPFAPSASLDAKRAACSFAAGAKVADTVEDAAAARAAITHVIVLTHENRAFDHMFGKMGGALEGFPSTYTNVRPDGGTAAPTHLTTACPADISHSATAIRAEWDDGKMDGFYETDGPSALGYYEAGDHVFFSWLVGTFATSDRYFCSTMGDTGHNRRFLYGASATETTSNVFTALNAAGVGWGNYYVGSNPIYNTYTFPAGDPHLHPYSDFLPDLDKGSLPAVTYLDTPSDEHPPGSMHDGENVVRDVLQHAFASPLWPHLAIFFNYDEGGGFFDHVPPPAACLPSASAADVTYDRQGFRVPLVVVSPFARKGYVSHLVHSHTSVLRFVELLHDLPALTARDANSDALLDMFDFACPDFAAPPPLGPASPKGC